MHHYGYWSGAGWLHMIGMVLFWVVVIGLVVYVVKEITGNNKSDGNNQGIDKPDSPEEIARKRYARGEISREEYKEIIENIKE